MPKDIPSETEDQDLFIDQFKDPDPPAALPPPPLSPSPSTYPKKIEMVRRFAPTDSTIAPGDASKNLLWLEQNHQNFPNQWVAIKGGKLLASGEKEHVHQQAEQSGEIEVWCLHVGVDYIAL